MRTRGDSERFTVTGIRVGVEREREVRRGVRRGAVRGGERNGTGRTRRGSLRLGVGVGVEVDVEGGGAGRRTNGWVGNSLSLEVRKKDLWGPRGSGVGRWKITEGGR